MRKFVFLILLLAAFFELPAQAQIIPTTTTLSAALSNGSANQVTLASSTGVVVRNGGIIQTVLIIDQEAAQVLDLVNGPTCTSTCTYTVTRGYRATSAMQHESGAIVVVSQLNKIYDTRLTGSCTASAQDFPRIILGANQRPTSIYYQTCTANKASPTSGVGEWRDATILDQSIPVSSVEDVPIGSVAYASIGSAQTTVAGSSYYSDAIVPSTQQFTGIKVLCGTCATDKFIGVVWDALGNVVATSALAGTTPANSNTFQTLAFTSKVILPGPARYFIGIQTNGTTATPKVIAASTYVEKLTGSATGTFGTVVAITPPTSDGGVGPVGYLY